MLNGIILINRDELRWRDAPAVYRSHKTFYSRWKRWSNRSVFARMMAGLAAEHRSSKTVMINASSLKAHRTATSMVVKNGDRGRLIARTKGGMNTNLHAICDHQERPIDLFGAAGQVGDNNGARALLCSLPMVSWLRGDRGFERLYKCRNRIEVNVR